MTDHYAPRAGFTPKLRFGPSILDKAEQCPRAYALQYLCGYDTQEPLWAEIADHTYDTQRRVYVAPAGYVGDWSIVPSRKRSTALGTECHARVEAHYDGKPEDPARPRWLDFPGQVAQAWLDVMPRPDECDEVYTELPIRLWPDALGIDVYTDVSLEGTSDLLLKVNGRSPFALTFVGDALHTADGYIVADWKTTRDWRYQKKAPGLYTNRQGVIYPLAAMRKLDLDAIPGRWAYSITDVKKRREARATEFVQTREHAEARVAEYFAEARVLREKGLRFLALTDGGGAGPIEEQRLEFVKAEYAPNLNACDDYGGCPHSWERGGACTARRSLGARTMASAGACAPAAAVIPLESLLRQSLQTTKGTDMHMNLTAPTASPAERVSPFKLRAQQANAAFQRSAPAASPPIDPATGLFAVEANAAGALDPQPSAPDAEDKEVTSVETPAPKGKRGRPPGSKNRRVGAAPGLSAPYDNNSPELESGATDAYSRAFAVISDADSVADLAGVPRGTVALDESADYKPFDVAAYETAHAPADSITLRQIAAAARAAGCEVTIYFPAKVPA